MEKCTSCERHLIGQERSCPFCGARQGGNLSQLRNTVAAGVTMMVLAACYGPPPGDKVDTMDSGVDADGDGFFLGEDCDDANADVNPGVAEVCDDGVDNDCDELTDADDEECAAK